MTRVRGSHHVLGVKHLLSKLRNGDGTVAGGASGSERGKADHEEMKTGEGHHVHGQLSKVGVKLTRETKTCGDTRHDDRDEVVQVTVSRGRELESTQADVIESLIVDTEGLIGVLNELMDGKSGVVRLNDGVRDLQQS